MQKSIILFDGVCNLCSWSVQFIIKRDPHARFCFAALQSPIGQQLLEEHGFARHHADSFVLIEGSTCYTSSTAALRVARGLKAPWPLLGALAVVPRPLRDSVYRMIARNRYRWFGQPDACMLPIPGLRERFLA